MLQSRNGLKARFALKSISTKRKSLLVALFYAAECQLNLAIVVKAYRCIAKRDYAEKAIVKFTLFIYCFRLPLAVAVSRQVLNQENHFRCYSTTSAHNSSAQIFNKIASSQPRFVAVVARRLGKLRSSIVCVFCKSRARSSFFGADRSFAVERSFGCYCCETMRRA